MKMRRMRMMKMRKRAKWRTKGRETMSGQLGPPVREADCKQLGHSQHQLM